jgi:hypothetical protein
MTALPLPLLDIVYHLNRVAHHELRRRNLTSLRVYPRTPRGVWCRSRQRPLDRVASWRPPWQPGPGAHRTPLQAAETRRSYCALTGRASSPSVRQRDPCGPCVASQIQNAPPLSIPLPHGRGSDVGTLLAKIRAATVRKRGCLPLRCHLTAARRPARRRSSRICRSRRTRSRRRSRRRTTPNPALETP